MTDDISEFEKINSAAIDAAATYERRSRKGLPADRWSDGTHGAALVAEGIAAMQKIIQLQTAVMAELYKDNLEHDERATAGLWPNATTKDK